MTTAAKLPPIHPGEILNEEFLAPMNITEYPAGEVHRCGSEAYSFHRSRAAVHYRRDGSAAGAPLREPSRLLDGTTGSIRSRSHPRPPIRAARQRNRSQPR